MDTGFPIGACTFNFTTLAGVEKPVPSLPPGIYPSAPQMLNFTAAQAIDPAQPLPLSWSPFAGSAAGRGLCERHSLRQMALQNV